MISDHDTTSQKGPISVSTHDDIVTEPVEHKHDHKHDHGHSHDHDHSHDT
jgi:hypothetical protein